MLGEGDGLAESARCAMPVEGWGDNRAAGVVRAGCIGASFD